MGQDTFLQMVTEFCKGKGRKKRVTEHTASRSLHMITFQSHDEWSGLHMLCWNDFNRRPVLFAATSIVDTVPD